MSETLVCASVVNNFFAPIDFAEEEGVATPVVLIAGDGIGPEVTAAMQAVVAGGRRRRRPGSRRCAGLGAAERFGDPLPDGHARPDPPLPRRPQGPLHHARRQGLPLHQRPPAPGARPVRQRPARQHPAGRQGALHRRRPRRRPREHRGAVLRPGARRRARRGREPAHHHARRRPSASSATPSSWPGTRAGAASPSATRPTCCR